MADYIDAERTALTEALFLLKQDYSPSCLQMASTREYVEDAISQLLAAGYRRTPSSSIGEDGLPKLPDTRAIRAGDSFPKVYALAYTADQMREYAREAVAADRRAHPRAMSNAEAAQWARDNGLNVPAQLEVTVTNYGNTVDKSAPEVKIERGRVWVVKGSQSFMLAYEPDADEPEATEWYANQLRGVLSSFTPCVNSAAQGEESLQAAQGVKTLPDDLLDELNDAVIEAFNGASAIKDWAVRDHWRDVLNRFENYRAMLAASPSPAAQPVAPAVDAAAICDGVAAKSRNHLFRSGAKICAGEIRAAQVVGDQAGAPVGEAITLYRPSNGTEGEGFMSHHCYQCKHDDDGGIGERVCEIIGNTMLYNVDEPEYPKEWRYGADGRPTCTKFELDSAHAGADQVDSEGGHHD